MKSTAVAPAGGTDEASVRSRTFRGAMVGVGASVVAAPLGFGITVMLARVSPAALGFYALVTLLLGVGSAFLSLGGPAVAARFTPELGAITPNAVTLIQGLGGAALAGLVSATIALAPIDTRWKADTVFLLLLAPAVSLWVGYQGALTSRLRFGFATIIQNTPTAFQFVFVGLLLAASPAFLKQHPRGIILTSYSIPIGLMASVYAVRLIGFLRRHPNEVRRLPADFWRYSIGVQLIVLLSFVFEGAERGVAALRGNGLVTLGIYFAALQTAQIVRRIPAIVGQAYLPGFASMAIREQRERLHLRVSHLVELVGFAVGTAVALSRTLVDPLFGSSYTAAGTALGALALTYAASAAVGLDCSYATATKRLRTYQFGLVLGSLSFVPLAWGSSVGAFAAARAAAVLVLQGVVLLAAAHAWRGRVRHMAATVAIGAGELAASAHWATMPASLGAWAAGVVLYLVAMGRIPAAAKLGRGLRTTVEIEGS